MCVHLVHLVDMKQTTAASRPVLGYRSTGTSGAGAQNRVVIVPPTVRTDIHQAFPRGYRPSPSTHLTYMQFDWGSCDCLDLDKFARADQTQMAIIFLAASTAWVTTLLATGIIAPTMPEIVGTERSTSMELPK